MQSKESREKTASFTFLRLLFFPWRSGKEGDGARDSFHDGKNPLFFRKINNAKTDYFFELMPWNNKKHDDFST